MDNNAMKQLLKGSSILSTGGGGSLKAALDLVDRINYEKIELLNIEDMKKDDYVFTVFAVGSIGNKDDIDLFVDGILKAKKYLEELSGDVFRAILPIEIGPCSLAETFYIASLLGLPVADADIVGGRCSPDIFLETISLYNIKRSPLILVGNDFSQVLDENDPYKIDKQIRELSEKTNSYVYVVGYSMKISDVEDIIAKGTLTIAMKLGDVNGVDDILNITAGKEMFFGVVADVDRSDKAGFLEGNIFINGVEKYSGKKMKIYFKNENIVAWIDKDVCITCPDVITIINSDFTGISNNDISTGMEVVVLGIPSNPLWRTQKGLDLFNPRKFGFNIDYKLIYSEPNK